MPGDTLPRALQSVGDLDVFDEDGPKWAALPEQLLVGLNDHGSDRVRAASAAELSRRAASATTLLIEVERDLLSTIKAYNESTKAQATRIELLTWAMAALAVAQVVAAVVQLSQG